MERFVRYYCVMTIFCFISKVLLSIYLAQMTPMNITEKEARDVLEYFRNSEEK